MLRENSLRKKNKPHIINLRKKFGNAWKDPESVEGRRLLQHTIELKRNRNTKPPLPKFTNLLHEVKAPHYEDPLRRKRSTLKINTQTGKTYICPIFNSPISSTNHKKSNSFNLTKPLKHSFSYTNSPIKPSNTRNTLTSTNAFSSRKVKENDELSRRTYSFSSCSNPIVRRNRSPVYAYSNYDHNLFALQAACLEKDLVIEESREDACKALIDLLHRQRIPYSIPSPHHLAQMPIDKLMALLKSLISDGFFPLRGQKKKSSSPTNVLSPSNKENVNTHNFLCSKRNDSEKELDESYCNKMNPNVELLSEKEIEKYSSHSDPLSNNLCEKNTRRSRSQRQVLRNQNFHSSLSKFDFPSISAITHEEEQDILSDRIVLKNSNPIPKNFSQCQKLNLGKYLKNQGISIMA